MKPLTLQVLLLLATCGALAINRGGHGRADRLANDNVNQFALSGAEDRPPPERAPMKQTLEQQHLPELNFFLAPPAVSQTTELAPAPGVDQRSSDSAPAFSRLGGPGGRDQWINSHGLSQRSEISSASENARWRRSLLSDLAPTENIARHPLGASERVESRISDSDSSSSSDLEANEGGSAHSIFQRLFRAVEYERISSRSPDSPCVPVDQRKTLTALLLSIVFPPSAHFYYGYVVIGIVQLFLSLLMYFPLFLACGWWWRPVQPVYRKPFSYGGDEDAFNDTLQQIRSRTTALVVAVCIAIVLAIVLTAWQVSMIVRLSTGDMQPANGCPSKPL